MIFLAADETSDTLRDLLAQASVVVSIWHILVGDQNYSPACQYFALDTFFKNQFSGASV